jgi:D-sedoheptulose 7-phosphate isomerase
VARQRGLLTVALAGRDGGAIARGQVAEYVLTTPADDPRIVKELQVTTYHVLWELVHVFFEQPGVLDPEVIA